MRLLIFFFKVRICKLYSKRHIKILRKRTKFKRGIEHGGWKGRRKERRKKGMKKETKYIEHYRLKDEHTKFNFTTKKIFLWHKDDEKNSSINDEKTNTMSPHSLVMDIAIRYNLSLRNAIGKVCCLFLYVFIFIKNLA